jgi:hypothetical protein
MFSEKNKIMESFITTGANSWLHGADSICRRINSGWKPGIELEYLL